MPSLLALATPLALLLPFLGQGGGELAASAALAGAPAAEIEQAEKKVPGNLVARYPASEQTVAPLDAFRGGQVLRQIRIERRVILRIQPYRSRTRNELLAQLPQRAIQTEYEERKMDKCVPVSGIAGVQTGSGNRLILFLRDARIVSANLEKACRARDFYSGFYVEKNDDGKLCVDRDKLQSRSGAKCEVERMRQLVAVDD